jgi:hypothetical protein
MDEAMEHIAQYGSRHTEAIVTSDYGHAMRFLKEVDASAVLVNASTRLNDGYQFGLGAEIGISTSRIHARGPMGLEELTCSKFIVLGSGQLREWMPSDAIAFALNQPGHLRFTSTRTLAESFDKVGGRVETLPNGHLVFYRPDGRRFLETDPVGHPLHECE